MTTSQLNKSISGIKNGAKGTLTILSIVGGDSNDKDVFTHELLLPNTQVLKLVKLLQMIHQLK